MSLSYSSQGILIFSEQVFYLSLVWINLCVCTRLSDTSKSVLRHWGTSLGKTSPWFTSFHTKQLDSVWHLIWVHLALHQGLCKWRGQLWRSLREKTLKTSLKIITIVNSSLDEYVLFVPVSRLKHSQIFEKIHIMLIPVAYAHNLWIFLAEL